MRPRLLASCAAITASILAGCSDDRIGASGDRIAAPAKTAGPQAVQHAKKPIGERFANVALGDGELGGIRGGLNTGSGVVVNFSFQEATYVNHNLTQSIIVPTITVSPGTASASLANTAAGGSAIAATIGNSATHAQVSSPALAIQSIVNNGLTSVVSNLGGGGITNHITNTANNQVVQQMITANIGITGLSQTVQQNVASTVMSRLTAANAQFR